MPPLRRAQSLRPCFQNRGTCNGRTRHVVFLRGGGSGELVQAQNRALDIREARWTQSRGASWWASLLGRTTPTGKAVSESREKHAGPSSPSPSTPSLGTDRSQLRKDQPSSSSPPTASRITEADADAREAGAEHTVRGDGVSEHSSVPIRHATRLGSRPNREGDTRHVQNTEHQAPPKQEGITGKAPAVLPTTAGVAQTEPSMREPLPKNIEEEVRETTTAPDAPAEHIGGASKQRHGNGANLAESSGLPHGRGGEQCADESERSATATALETGPEPGINRSSKSPSEVERELQQLREQVHRLQEALQAGQTLQTPRSESRPGARYRRNAPHISELEMLRSGKKNLSLILAAARSMLVVTTSRLRFVMMHLENMSYPGASRLGKYIRDSVYPMFRSHMRESAVEEGSQAPRTYYIERSLRRIENLHEEVYNSLRATLPMPEPVVPEAAPVRRQQEHTGAVASYDPLKGAARKVHTESNPPSIEKRTPDETPSQEANDQSLLAELFPEATSYVQPHYEERKNYTKLNPPEHVAQIRRVPSGDNMSPREKMIKSFQNRGEPLVALQLTHCSTELTEADFRRLVPRGKHIESWIRDGEFQKIIPGRDPWTLERKPFYYLLFKSFESALAYKKNASRLHMLAAMHQPTSIFSAIPSQPGLLEDGEDINKVLSTYFLKPLSLRLSLNMVMQPYNPSLRLLFERGGYEPIVPNVGANGQTLYKVLLHIEGWEPSREDLYHIFARHARDRGLTWPLHNGDKGVHRLRDVVDVHTRFQAVSSANPRAANGGVEYLSLSEYSDADPLQQQQQSEGAPKTELKQVLINRLYNRWILEFEEHGAADRFVRLWHRRILPNPKGATWKDKEEPRMINAEVLW